jgi:Sec-independent protein translocase protein TatA
MAKYSSKDQRLLSEAYSYTLLKESIPAMTLRQVNANIDLMNESELKYITTVLERFNNHILEEGIFSGVGNVLKGVGKGIASGANALGRGIRGTGAALGQVKDNVGDMYNAGKNQASSKDAVTKAQQLSSELVALLTNAVQQGILDMAGRKPEDLSLSEIAEVLANVNEFYTDENQKTLQKGFTGGAGEAFKKGFQPKQPQPQQQQQAQQAQQAPQGLPQQA